MEFKTDTYLECEICVAKRQHYEGNEKHGNAARFIFSSEAYEEILEKCCSKNEWAFNPYSEGLALYVYVDGSISMVDNVYNSRSECYIETEQYHFEGEERTNVIEFLDYIMANTPLVFGGMVYITHCEALARMLERDLQ